MSRKRNNRCRNKVCACTGECFIDDGTGDFAKPTDSRIGLERLRSRMLGWEDCDDEIKQLENALRVLIREAQAVADDHHKPRYARLDEALESAKVALSGVEEGC